MHRSHGAIYPCARDPRPEVCDGCTSAVDPGECRFVHPASPAATPSARSHVGGVGKGHEVAAGRGTPGVCLHGQSTIGSLLHTAQPWPCRTTVRLRIRQRISRARGTCGVCILPSLQARASRLLDRWGACARRGSTHLVSCGAVGVGRIRTGALCVHDDEGGHQRDTRLRPASQSEAGNRGEEQVFVPARQVARACQPSGWRSYSVRRGVLAASAGVEVVRVITHVGNRGARICSAECAKYGMHDGGGSSVFEGMWSGVLVRGRAELGRYHLIPSAERWHPLYRCRRRRRRKYRVGHRSLVRRVVRLLNGGLKPHERE